MRSSRSFHGGLSHFLWGGICLASITLAFSGCDSKKEAPKRPPPTVIVSKAESKDVPIYQEWVGTMQGFQNATIQAKVEGYLETRDYQEGSFVKKGATLFTIDPRPFQATLAQAQATLKQAEASEIRTRLDADRATELYGKGVISQAEYDTKTQLHKADQAAVAAAQANVESANINLSYTTIQAPFNGIVGEATAQIGDLVGSPGSAALTTMSMVDPIKVYFPISENQYMQAADAINQLENEAEAKRPKTLTMILDTGDTYPDKGQFYFADREVNPRTGTINIGATFPNENALLRPGQFARIRAKVKTLEDAIVVPSKAVSEMQGTYSVFVIDSDNTAKTRSVQVGPQVEDEWVIDSGLKAGETIIVEGVSKVKDGTNVNPKSVSAAKAEKASGDSADASSDSSSPSPTASPSPSSSPATTPAPAPSPAASSSSENGSSNS